MALIQGCLLVVDAFVVTSLTIWLLLCDGHLVVDMVWCAVAFCPAAHPPSGCQYVWEVALLPDDHVA